METTQLRVQAIDLVNQYRKYLTDEKYADAMRNAVMLKLTDDGDGYPVITHALFGKENAEEMATTMLLDNFTTAIWCSNIPNILKKQFVNEDMPRIIREHRLRNDGVIARYSIIEQLDAHIDNIVKDFAIKDHCINYPCDINDALYAAHAV